MKKYWNYRLLAKRTSNDVRFGIYEVHYKDDKPTSCTVNEINPVTFASDIEDQVESMKWQLEMMLKACDKPILDYDNFPNEYLPYSRKKKLELIEKYLK